MDESVQALREQLRSVKALHQSGVLDDAALGKASAGLERKLLDAVLEAPAASPGTGRRISNPAIAVAMLVAALAGAGIYHWQAGPPSAVASASRVGGMSPDLLASLQDFTGLKPGAAPGTQAPHAMGNDQIAAMVDGLARRLERQPDDAEGWQMLARSYAVLGRSADALPAFRKAVELRGDDPILLADYADTLAVGQDRRIEGEPLQIAKKALEIDPNQPKALSLVATAAFNRGEFGKAAELWDNLVRTAPADNALREPAQRALAEARERAGGAQVAAPAPSKD